MTDETPSKLARKQEFPKQWFPSNVLKLYGKKFLKNPEEALAYLRLWVQENGSKAPSNLNPPVKCNIVAKSRPIEEWDVARVSNSIQNFVYGLSKAQFEAFDLKSLTSAAQHKAWSNEVGIDTLSVKVMAMNLILKNAANIYLGVEVKALRKNSEETAKYESSMAKVAKGGRIPKPLVLEKIFDADGCLINKPGVNPNIYCYSNTVRIYKKSSEVTLPVEYEDYNRDPNLPLTLMVPQDRTLAKKGQPGYVPQHVRGNLSTKTHKRRRLRYGPKGPEANRIKANSALLVTIQIGSDWVVVDARGLLRNARWRDVLPKEASLKDLIDLFTGDPVIDPVRNLVTFCYKQGVVKVWSKRGSISYKKAPAALKAMQDSGKSVGLVSIDLGQINPVAARVARLKNDGSAESLETFSLDSTQVEDIARYRSAWDDNQKEIRDQVFESMSESEQEELTLWESTHNIKQQVCDHLGLSEKDIPWDEIKYDTSYITTKYLELGGSIEKVMYVPKYDQGDKSPRRYRDGQWANMFRVRVSEPTRKKHLNLIWEEQKKNKGFAKLTTRKRELVRRVVNTILTRTKKRTQCDEVVVIMESLTVGVKPGMGVGTGERPKGWSNLFKPKNENRWFMQAFSQALLQLPVNKGMTVIEVFPSYTSQTCPVCNYVDKDNRDKNNRERFCCLNCNTVLNADLDVATHNIMRVALEGKALAKGESSGTEKKPRGARKTKPSEITI